MRLSVSDIVIEKANMLVALQMRTKSPGGVVGNGQPLKRCSSTPDEGQKRAVELLFWNARVEQ